MRKLLSFLLVLSILVCPFSAFAQDVLYISNAEDLCVFAERVNGGDSMAGREVVLTADIELEEAFAPIGADPTCPFSGNFDGGGHSISGLVVEGGAYCGLFGCVTNGTVKNLNVKNARVTGEDYCGILVGRLYGYKGNALVENCTVSGTAKGNCYAGGLAGTALAAAFENRAEVCIKNCVADCTVKGNIYVGGVAGVAEARGEGKTATVCIEDCTAFGRANANGTYGTMCGGICGALSAKKGGGNAIARLKDCRAYTCVEAENVAAGGACGTVGVVGNGTAEITDCTAAGLVSGGAKVGGFCGKVETEGGTVDVRDCVAAGCVIGDDSHPTGFGVGMGCTAAETLEEIDAGGFSLGDCNLDGEIDSLDAAVILKIDSQMGKAGAFCDVNIDGNVDSLDAARILKYDAFLIPSL